MRKLNLVLFFMFSTSIASASFLDALVDFGRDVAVEIVADKASDLIDMAIDARAQQTASEREVARNYRMENGELPSKPIIGEYSSDFLPGVKVGRGTEVSFSSMVKVVPGKNRENAEVIETLTIWDNDNSNVELKSVSKTLTGTRQKGGVFQSVFEMTFPKEIPQGIYPISSSLILNGAKVNEKNYELQLVQVNTPRSALLAVYDK